MENESLKFFYGGQFEGFRAAGLAAYNNIDPDTLIRELVQNALDAGNRIDREVIEIEISLEKVRTKSIPAYFEYKSRFEAACKTQKEKSCFEQARSIAENITSALNSEFIDVLWVVDNGEGLGDKHMESLLSDGQSMKSDASSTGSYGNGHMTSFPASNLRYMLYGGVFNPANNALKCENETRTKICAGHTILATHIYNGEFFGKDGFFVDELLKNDLFNRFQFYNTSFPEMIDEKLKYIENKFETGSAIGILAFNKFNNYEDYGEVVECIRRVVASHFTPAIYSGKIRVKVCAPSICKYVIKDTLEEILEPNKDRVRKNRNSIGPSGNQIWESLKTLDSNYAHQIEVSDNLVNLHFRNLDGGGVHLFNYIEMECGSPTEFHLTKHHHFLSHHHLMH